MRTMVAQTMTATSSTHGAALVRGTHQLRICGYGKRKHIKSRGFEAGGHLWAVSCVFGNNHRLWSVSFELLHTDSATDVLAMATLRIEHPGEGDGRPSDEWRSKDAHVFPAWPSPSDAAMATCRSWELSLPDGHEWWSWEDDDYIRLSDGSWQERFVDKHGCFYLYCAVDVLQEDSDRHPDQISVVPPATISKDLGKLLLYHQEEGEPDTDWRRCMLPDVTFVVEGTEIQAHKLVLAMRSPVFAAEFRWQPTESTLHVHDMGASTFRAMLHFLYTDELPPMKPSKDVAMALDLMVAADRYDIKSLRVICENILYESVDAASITETLMVVHGRQSFQPVEAFCIQYMASDPDVYAAVKETEDYKELKESCCNFILDITDKVARMSIANTPGPDAPSSSSSRQQQMNLSMHYSSEEVKDTHEFKIPHFIAVQRRHGVDEEISSSTFQVGGYEWKVKVYPSSSSENVKGFVSVYIELLTDPGPSGVNTTVRFMMAANCPYPPSIKWLEKTFTTKSDWGYAKFIALQCAKSRHLVEDGSITIHCDVSVMKKVCTTNFKDGVRGTMPPSNIVSHLEQLLVSKQGSDMSFLVEESEIRAHGLLIAMHSQILYEEVAAANKDNHVIVVNDTTVAVFKALLHFIYTDELPSMKDLPPGVDQDEVTIAQDLLVAACWFRLERMRAMCENLLATLISEENASSTLKLAKDLHCSNLEHYCKEFIMLNRLFRGRRIDFRLVNRFSIY